MTAPLTAYIDMEFAGIYGTRQELQVPIEIGVVMQNPDSGTLSFAATSFSHDIDVELWKNTTDEIGKRIGGHRKVFNLADTGSTKTFDRAFRLDAERQKKARMAVRAVHADLRQFMQALNDRGIATLVFYARQREMDAFRRARVKTDGFFIRDLQAEIKHRFGLQEHVSLDRMALITGFGFDRTSIFSAHFSYPVPEKFCHDIQPHKAIGDAARIFLVARELSCYPGEFKTSIEEHITRYNNRKQGENDSSEA
jgi:hypothetical protein